MKQLSLAVLGAAVGAVVGYVVFVLLLRVGLYALVAPGALIGIGAGFARCRSVAVPIMCGALALVASLLSEWLQFPFAADGSLAFFLTHVGQLTTITMIFIALGVAAAVWLSLPARDAGHRPPPGPRSAA